EDDPEPGPPLADQGRILLDGLQGQDAEQDGEEAGQDSEEGEPGDQSEVAGGNGGPRPADRQQQPVHALRLLRRRLQGGVQVFAAVATLLGDGEDHLPAERTGLLVFGHGDTLLSPAGPRCRPREPSGASSAGPARLAGPTVNGPR